MKTKQIKMGLKLAGAMKNQLTAFKKKFGREPSRLARTTPVPRSGCRHASADIHRKAPRARQSLRLQRRLAWTQTAFCEHSASTTKGTRKARHTLDPVPWLVLLLPSPGGGAPHRICKCVRRFANGLADFQTPLQIFKRIFMQQNKTMR